MCFKKKPGTLLQASAIKQDARSYFSALIGRLISFFLSSVKQRIIIIHTSTLYRCPLRQPGTPHPPRLISLSLVGESKDMAGHPVEPLPHQEGCAGVVKATSCNTVVWGKINMHFYAAHEGESELRNFSAMPTSSGRFERKGDSGICFGNADMDTPYCKKKNASSRFETIGCLPPLLV